MPTTRPLSQLIHFRVQDGAGGPPVVTMHDHNQYARDVESWGIAASPGGSVKALESYKGVFVGHDIAGYTWFLGPDDAPSPIFFGDSLAEIERFLWDEVDRSTAPEVALPWLVGIGQGGIMAIATALAVPELISGVIAVDAFLPRVGGWDPPLAPLHGMPILLVNPRPIHHPRVLSGEALEQQLRAWDAAVETRQIPVASPDTLDASMWIGRHGTRTLTR